MEIGISLVSLFPWSVLDPWGITRWAKKVGFQLIQGIPLRGVDEKFVNNSPLPISFCEDAWNPGTLGKVVKGKIDKDPGAPKLHDWLLFPDPQRCAVLYQEMIRTGATPVVHHLGHMDEKSLLEVSPKLGLSPQAIVKAVRARRLVLDTYHLRRSPWPDEISYNPEGVSPLGDWRQSLPELLPYAGLIHVSPHRDSPELQQLLQGKKTELSDMLAMIKSSGFKGPFVIEATIGLRGFSRQLLTATMLNFKKRLE